MNHLWKLKKAFMKDLLDAYPEPKPATTTVATLLKRMADKKFIAYTLYGKSREYYPLVKKKDYFANNTHLMLVIYRLFSIFNNTKDLRFLNWIVPILKVGMGIQRTLKQVYLMRLVTSKQIERKKMYCMKYYSSTDWT